VLANEATHSCKEASDLARVSTPEFAPIDSESPPPTPVGNLFLWKTQNPVSFFLESRIQKESAQEI
jgi:hypothetical protein